MTVPERASRAYCKILVAAAGLAATNHLLAAQRALDARDWSLVARKAKAARESADSMMKHADRIIDIDSGLKGGQEGAPVHDE